MNSWHSLKHNVCVCITHKNPYGQKYHKTLHKYQFVSLQSYSILFYIYICMCMRHGSLDKMNGKGSATDEYIMIFYYCSSILYSTSWTTTAATTIRWWCGLLLLFRFVFIHFIPFYFYSFTLSAIYSKLNICTFSITRRVLTAHMRGISGKILPASLAHAHFTFFFIIVLCQFVRVYLWMCVYTLHTIQITINHDVINTFCFRWYRAQHRTAQPAGALSPHYMFISFFLIHISQLTAQCSLARKWNKYMHHNNEKIFFFLVMLPHAVQLTYRQQMCASVYDDSHYCCTSCIVKLCPFGCLHFCNLYIKYMHFCCFTCI